MLVAQLVLQFPVQIASPALVHGLPGDVVTIVGSLHGQVEWWMRLNWEEGTGGDQSLPWPGIPPPPPAVCCIASSYSQFAENKRVF